VRRFSLSWRGGKHECLTDVKLLGWEQEIEQQILWASGRELDVVGFPDRYCQLGFTGAHLASG
jgi:hypothetical protein